MEIICLYAKKLLFAEIRAYYSLTLISLKKLFILFSGTPYNAKGIPLKNCQI